MWEIILIVLCFACYEIGKIVAYRRAIKKMKESK